MNLLEGQDGAVVGPIHHHLGARGNSHQLIFLVRGKQDRGGDKWIVEMHLFQRKHRVLLGRSAVPVKVEEVNAINFVFAIKQGFGKDHFFVGSFDFFLAWFDDGLFKVF